MKAIIFDCDGVLIDSEILYQEIQMAALEKIGLAYEKDEYLRRFMGTGDKNYYMEVDKDYQEKFQKPLPDTFERNLKATLEREFAVRLKPIAEMSSLIKNLKHPVAVASSSRLDFLLLKLAQTELDTYFHPHIYSADMVERAKPFPDLFLYTADQLNKSAHECIVIEDSENGVLAGIAANMYVIGFCGGGHCDAAHALKLQRAGANDIAMTPEELEEKIQILVT